MHVQPVIMAGRCWLDASLDRSSKLGLEVLQRAKRRSESLKNVGSSHRDDSCTEKHTEVQSSKTGMVFKWNAFRRLLLSVCCINKSIKIDMEITNIHQ